MTHLNTILILMESVKQMPSSDKKDADDGVVKAALKGLGKGSKPSLALLIVFSCPSASITYIRSINDTEVLIMQRKRGVKAAVSAPSHGFFESQERMQHKAQ